jgi:ribosomal protein L4
MTVTRDFQETVRERVRRDAAFRKALAAEVDKLVLAGEIRIAKAILVDYLDSASR